MNDTATETAPEASDAPLLFTDAAARKVSELIAGEGNPKLMLRVFVQGGGCSGFQYGFTFDEVVNELPEWATVTVPQYLSLPVARKAMPPVVIDVEPLLPVFLAVGTGYGTENDWRHGMYQGPLKVESLTWDFNNPADKAKMVGFVDAVAR